ncbi:MAG: hypothetical protein EOR30_34320 [Mesorhizobium sp.]|uniref:hypothetical protein n=1 Tax=unclassified Mesorhizobium TaxID=325217 RepID=UPI000FCCC447|nr:MULTISPECIES: hypothetical protein [unclassified Mesorhizobium]RUV66747.1 hypothetical protein EOA78_33035 [Mesorhizobium sp. M5C.F.Cr.IN.023.01.1.1]RWF80815.1 MAG: hypothetical protein EOQ36_32095 [Mesorhizobium sp.]RWF88409.1 MAG: hypothetical protein EOQ45_32370 [Mesorhizobium sp.]RWI32043.1 MAG: hypothetical protein EOR14_35475 [Mesorhizobium sp.]RWI41560.1 MAG: hypothetical protein EOR15_32710 [Mesorhizobium sp.]
MKGGVLGLILTLSLINEANASYVDDLVNILESVCIASDLKPERLDALIAPMADALGYRLRELPADEVIATGPNAKRSWLVQENARAFFISRGEKQTDGRTSVSCSVTAKIEDQNNLLRSLEAGFAIKKVGQETQGTSTFTI